MLVDIGDKKIVDLLKFYLGRFFVKIPAPLLGRLKSEVTDYGSVVATGDMSFLKCVGSYMLLTFGRKGHREMSTYDLIEVYLGRVEGEEEGSRFYDVETELLILTHLRATMENRQLENLVIHTMGQRALAGKHTLLLLEANLPQVQARAKELKFLVVDQRQGVSGVQAEI